MFNTSKFSNWPPFSGETFLPDVVPEVEYTSNIAMSISEIFKLMIDALAQILTEIYQFQNLTYFVT